ncbi:MAG: metallophosphoesterase [Cytophagales bacterium]|nr:metallophosphoesterase [Armatimonadota bacterium]
MPAMPLTRRQILTHAGLGGFAALYSASRVGADGEPSPSALWPGLERKLHDAADRHTRELSRRSPELRLESARGAYTADLHRGGVERGETTRRGIAPDGLLTFAVNTPAPVYVRGTLALSSPPDLRPGLRAYVLCDSTLIGAPMVRTQASWGTAKVTDPAPSVLGNEPEDRIPIEPFLLPAGRHYLTVAGPHFRSAGAFQSLTLSITDRAVETPLCRFALITDTHVQRVGQSEWMNIKMGGAAPAALRDTLRALASEGVSFVQHGGDMTEGATRDEFALLSSVLRDQPLPVYGCLGNHDVYHAESRADALDLLSRHFPSGALDYTYRHGGLRFVVLDENISNPKTRDAKRRWLEAALQQDRKTPTIVVWHYAPLNRGGVSNCGFRLEDWSKAGRESLLDLVRAAPHVVATLNGHDHWDEVNVRDGLTHLQNAAFVEWPNSYRVFRVYPDRVEWEVRQVANRGLVRQSFAARKALSWMIATADGDLSGSFPLQRPGV